MQPQPDLSILIGEKPDADALTCSGISEIRLGIEVIPLKLHHTSGREPPFPAPPFYGVLLFCAPRVPSAIQIDMKVCTRLLVIQIPTLERGKISDCADRSSLEFYDFDFELICPFLYQPTLQKDFCDLLSVKHC